MTEAQNAVAAHLRRCMTLEMALPFRRIMRLAAGLHLRFCNTNWVKQQIDENGIFIRNYPEILSQLRF